MAICCAASDTVLPVGQCGCCRRIWTRPHEAGQAHAAARLDHPSVGAGQGQKIGIPDDSDGLTGRYDKAGEQIRWDRNPDIATFTTASRWHGKAKQAWDHWNELRRGASIARP